MASGVSPGWFLSDEAYIPTVAWAAEAVLRAHARRTIDSAAIITGLLTGTDEFKALSKKLQE